MADVVLLRLHPNNTPPTRHVMDEKVAKELLQVDGYIREEDYDSNTRNDVEFRGQPLSPAGPADDADCIGCAEKRLANVPPPEAEEAPTEQVPSPETILEPLSVVE